MPYRSSVPDGGDGFDALVRAEWTKLRSVPGWMLTLAAAVVLIVVVSLLAAVGVRGEKAAGFRDEGNVVRRSLSGDGSVVAQVTALRGSREWAKAGLIVRAGTRPGAPYAAVMVTRDHGVHLQSNFTTDKAGSEAAAPRWLKLTRAGQSIMGYESADGASWSRVGTIELNGLPRTVEIGPFVASPGAVETRRQFGGEAISEVSTDGTATFGDVRVEASAAQPPARWRDNDGAARVDGTFTVTGTGDIGAYEFGDDIIRTIFAGVLVGLLAIVVLAVDSVTSEYRRGTIRTTFAVCPRRGRVLAAKAIVLGAATLAAGLVASLGAFLLSRPILRSNDIAPAPLFDGPALRAVLGTAALLAVVAVLSLGVATILRRGATAIAVVVLILLVPHLLATGLPLSIAMWLERVTPAAGFAIQRTLDRYDSAIAPWAGFAVLCGYAAVALALAAWRLQRQDA